MTPRARAKGEPLQLPPEVETLGDAIRWVRTQRRMTLRALARACGLSAPFLSDMEHNRRSTDKLPAIAAALDVEVDMLEKMSGRLTRDMREWIAKNPDVVEVLRDMRRRRGEKIGARAKGRGLA
jgi:transcriptional regulator with XRE-family HTH domain